MENKYKSFAEFRKDYPNEYAFLYKKGLVNKFREDMGWEIKKNKPSNYWDKERCLEDALKYNLRKDWVKNSPSSYNSSLKNGWYKECIVHMFKVYKPKGYWIKDKCLKEALKYTTKTEWSKNSRSSYSSALKNGWYEECTAHMLEIHKPSGYWTFERCIDEAKKYKTKNEWQKKSGAAYKASLINGSYDKCTNHMLKKQIKPINYWNKERCIEEALKYKTRSEWDKNNSSSNSAARKNGWYEECTKHMTKHGK